MIQIILASFLMYVSLSFMLRLFGKKEFSQLNVFDFVVFLVLAEIMTLSLESFGDLTLLHSILATLTIILSDRFITFFTMRSKKLRDMFEGVPSYIILDGKLQQETMKEIRYSIDDLTHQLRSDGIDSISKVAFAVLETNGTLSIIEKDQCVTKLPDSLIMDGVIDDECLKLIHKDRSWLMKELKNKGIDDYHNVMYCVFEKQNLFVIEKE